MHRRLNFFRRGNIILFSLFIFLLAAASCNRERAQLQYTNARDVVPPLGNLIFEFDRDLASDSLMNRWLDKEYISFSPKINGQFRWETPQRLVFSPAAPLRPATSYTATLNTKPLLADQDAVKNIQKTKDIQFKTADIGLMDVQGFWLAEPGSSAAIPQLDLVFNYPVDPKALQEKLKISEKDAPLNYELVTLSNQHKVSVKIRDVRAEDRDYTFDINIGEGLKPVNGENGSEKETAQNYTLPSPFILVINDVETEHNGTTGTLRVKANQPISSESISRFVEVDPKVSVSSSVNQNELIISGNAFNVDLAYNLKLLKGLKGTLGGQLKEDYEHSFAFGKLEPQVSFREKNAMYLGSRGARNIEVSITNLTRVKVVISKIYENNLLPANRFGYYPGGDYYDYYDESGSQYSVGDVIYEQTIETSRLQKYGNNRLFRFDFSDKVPQAEGIYHIQVRSEDDYWISDSRFVSLSDIGLIARQSERAVTVFANSLRDAGALSNVNVLVYGANNQLVGKGTTDGEGVAVVNLEENPVAGFKPAMVIAKLGSDFTYLPFNSTAINMSRYEIGGKRMNATGLDAYLYGERDIYRPGETMHLAAIIRGDGWKSPGRLPVKFKVTLPNGQEMRSLRQTLNDEGSAEISLPLQSSALTGSYLVELYNGNEVLLASKNIRVESFMPDRIYLQTTLNRESAAPGDNIGLQLFARNYFGPPAAGRNYETEIQVERNTFSPKQYSNYTFSLNRDQTLFDKIVREGKISDSGYAAESFNVPDLYKNLGLLRAKFYSTVFDETGRPVNRFNSADIYTQPVFFGIADNGYNYFPLHQPARFSVIAVNKSAAPVSATAGVKVIKHEYRTTLARTGDYFRYESNREEKVVHSGNIQVRGENTVYAFTPRSAGDYEVRISIPGAASYVSRRFYSYGSWGSADASFEVNREGNITIETDKTEYNTGSSANVLFKTPFNGKMLITLENDKVLHHQYVDVTNRNVSVSLPMNAEYAPNAYITATLFKPHTDSDMPLTVAHGFQNVAIVDNDRKMEVRIEAPSHSRSGRKQTVRVKAAANSQVSLAAVDQGILAVTNYRTPDPFAYFFQQRALQVKGFNMYPLLFPEISRVISSTGGDASAELDQRQNPMADNRVKLMSYWSGLRKANMRGIAEFEVDIPEFSGEIRYMAVAVKDDKFGAASQVTTVADPLVISSAIPRFLSPGDTLEMPVMLANNTDERGNAVTRVTTGGGIQVLGNAQSTTALQAKREGQTVFRLVAPAQIGEGYIEVESSAFGEKFTQRTEISVRPAAPLQHRTGSMVIDAGQNKALRLDGADFIPQSLRYHITLGRSPVAGLGSALDFLVNYPYGCTEQVISTAFPQLYYADLAMMSDNSGGNAASAAHNVQEAIRTIKRRQIYNGGLTLWDDQSSLSWWTSAYAAHFLVEAGKAGYEVDNSLLNTLLGYLGTRLRNRETTEYIYNRTDERRYAPKEVAYSLYVLALAQRANVPAMNYYKANPGELAPDSKYLLAAAYALAGDRKQFAELLPGAFPQDTVTAETGGSFASAIRDEAVALNALIDVDPTHAQIPVMARHISEKMAGRRWYSTQEASFGFLSLGKMARQLRDNTATARVQVNGKQVGERMEEKLLRLNQSVLKSLTPTITTSGSGKVYVSWQTSGISASGRFVEEDNYLRVRRSFYDRYGRQITGNSFKQNDLVVIRLTLESAYSGTVENVVVTDMLPAGFEIENSRISALPGTEWITNATPPIHIDMRDDRIHFFTNAEGTQNFYYSVRAVSPGSFRLGPASAEAMYNGEYRSYHGAGVVKVVK